MHRSFFALLLAAALPVHADWYLDNESSRLSFISTHSGSQSEVHRFLTLHGQIAADGRVAVPVEFALDKADILDASRPQIDAMAQMLKDEAGLRLSVEGHTDNTGAPARNRPLSEERARAVVAALTQQGIDAKRLEAKGFGADKPVADNASDEGRARNRRVELVRLP